MTIPRSAFTFGHNLIESGYPIVEAIKAVADYVDEVLFVDMQSTDNTRAVLEDMASLWYPIRIIDGVWWPGTAGRCLANAHWLHRECKYDQIIHFEADEVYSGFLIQRIASLCDRGLQSLNVWRTQIGQNFQRARWYAEQCHRVFVKGTVIKEGHTTNDDWAKTIPVEYGFLWDCASTCRDNFIPRMQKQGDLWGHDPRYRVTPYHFMAQPFELNTETELRLFLEEPQWMFTRSPFDLPDVLKPLVGKVKYEPEI